MLIPLLAAWLTFVVLLWLAVCRKGNRHKNLTVDAADSLFMPRIALVAVPPSLLLLASLLLLLQASPVAQLNASDSGGLSGWSAWVRNWPALVAFSSLMLLVYGALAAHGSAQHPGRPLNCALIYAACASACGLCFHLTVYPTA